MQSRSVPVTSADSDLDLALRRAIYCVLTDVSCSEYPQYYFGTERESGLVTHIVAHLAADAQSSRAAFGLGDGQLAPSVLTQARVDRLAHVVPTYTGFLDLMIAHPPTEASTGAEKGHARFTPLALLEAKPNFCQRDAKKQGVVQNVYRYDIERMCELARVNQCRAYYVIGFAWDSKARDEGDLSAADWDRQKANIALVKQLARKYDDVLTVAYLDYIPRRGAREVTGYGQVRVLPEQAVLSAPTGCPFGTWDAATLNAPMDARSG